MDGWAPRVPVAHRGCRGDMVRTARVTLCTRCGQTWELVLPPGGWPDPPGEGDDGDGRGAPAPDAPAAYVRRFGWVAGRALSAGQIEAALGELEGDGWPPAPDDGDWGAA